MSSTRIVSAVTWLLAASILAADPPLAETQSLAGNWKGALEIGPLELRIYFQFEQPAGKPWQGVMVSPDQSEAKTPLSKVTLTGDDLQLEVVAIGGSYTGRLDRATRQVKGAWKQGGNTYRLNLAFTEGDWKLPRPQTPKAPFPYAVREVVFENMQAEVKLAGTLTHPNGKGPFPAVILISGSGPQDRDETIFAHRPFAVIADFLSRRGWAVLRYDDRGYGKSTGNFSVATSADFADDAEAAFDFLKTRPEIDGRRIGFAGHSEGGLIAPTIAARRAEVAFLVLLAAPGLSGREIALAQAEDFARLRGYSDQFIQASRPLSEEMIQLITSDLPAAEIESRAKVLREKTEAMLTDADRQLYEKNKHEASGNANLANQPWHRFFLKYDPADSLRHVKSCPVLALTGERDVQVRPRVNLAALERHLQTAGNDHVTVKELKGLNHLFQTAKTGEFKEYGQIEETFSPTALEEIHAWLKREFE